MPLTGQAILRTASLSDAALANQGQAAREDAEPEKAGPHPCPMPDYFLIGAAAGAAGLAAGATGALVAGTTAPFEAM